MYSAKYLIFEEKHRISCLIIQCGIFDIFTSFLFNKSRFKKKIKKEKSSYKISEIFFIVKYACSILKIFIKEILWIFSIKEKALYA